MIKLSLVIGAFFHGRAITLKPERKILDQAMNGVRLEYSR